MSLTVHTARVSYGGSDRLDVTRKGGNRLGIYFAPSWDLLSPYLAKRKAGTLTDHDWTAYVAAYTREMRESFLTSRRLWDAVLAMPEVTLVCYCTDPARCHRTVLAEILVKLGATYAGERSTST